MRLPRRAAVLLTGLLLLPFWYIDLRLRGVDPRDYFLARLEGKRQRFALMSVLIVCLQMSARNYDAPAALRVARCLASPFPLWSLGPREMRVLLEATIWLGEVEEFHRLWAEFQRNEFTPAGIRESLFDYLPIARDEAGATLKLKDQLVLPALHWERTARTLASVGMFREAAAALYEALRFVPDLDPRRSELVARLMAVNATAAPEGR